MAANPFGARKQRPVKKKPLGGGGDESTQTSLEDAPNVGSLLERIDDDIQEQAREDTKSKSGCCLCGCR